MFRIGEFSQIARVSGRLLRYYDSIGLLPPQRIDPATGYRWYSAAQLPRLNRILALKDLGLSLDQIGRMLDDGISIEEIRGMLMLKKAELERTLQEEAARLRNIETRLAQIEMQGTLADYDVVVKAVPARPFLSIRALLPTLADAMALVGEVVRATNARVPERLRENLTVVAHADFDEEDLDLEVGVALAGLPNRRVALGDGRALALGELPAAEQMATIVRSGPIRESHQSFGALGVWMEANRFDIAGPCREVFLEPPGDPERAVIEIQFPVTKAA